MGYQGKALFSPAVGKMVLEALPYISLYSWEEENAAMG